MTNRGEGPARMSATTSTTDSMNSHGLSTQASKILLRSEYSQEKIAQNNKKMFEDMNMMMAMGAMPGMIPGAAAGAQMPGLEGIPPEMQQMMQQMMASGVDPSQMDPQAMFAAMQGGAWRCWSHQELREATKVKDLALKEALVKVKISSATINNRRVTVEEGILEGAVVAGVDGDPVFAFGIRRSSGFTK
jgi:hypothetical protein